MSVFSFLVNEEKPQPPSLNARPSCVVAGEMLKQKPSLVSHPSSYMTDQQELPSYSCLRPVGAKSRARVCAFTAGIEQKSMLK